MLPTTIETNGKTIVLHPKAYPDLNPSEAVLLARLTVLTQNGAKSCVYTTKAAMEEFGISEKTARRLLKSLQDHGYITAAKVSSLTFGPNVRQITLDPAKLGAPEPEIKPILPVASQPASIPAKPLISKPVVPKLLNPDIAAAMACPIAGDQPLVKPEDWEKRCAAIWALVIEICRRGNERALLNRCCDIAYKCDVSAPASGLVLLDLFDAKAKRLGSCSREDSTNTAVGFFTYYFTAKFLRDHQECPKEVYTLQAWLRAFAKAYLSEFNTAAKAGQENLAAKVMTDLEFPAELKSDPRMTDFLNAHLVPRMQGDIMFNMIVEEQLCRVGCSHPRAVNALNEPLPLYRDLSYNLYNLRRKRELLTYAPAEGVDPRGLPCYQPFINMVKFDLGPALDQTKFGRFPCYDLEGNLHDFKFDFSALAHLLSSKYQDNITTNNLKPWEFGYTTCFDSDPCLPKAISDYLIFALVTELIAPLTAENVFYNMQEHQEDNLLELFQDPKTHRSLLLFACDVIYPDPSGTDFDARPIYNYVKQNYCAGPKSDKDFAAFVIANNVVRILGDKEQAQKVLKAIKRQLVISGRAPWVVNIRRDTPTSMNGVYTSVLRDLLIPNSEMDIVPRLTYPFMLMRKLFGFRHIPTEDRARVGLTTLRTVVTDPVAQRDLSVLKSTYVADYPFLAQLGEDYE